MKISFRLLSEILIFAYFLPLMLKKLAFSLNYFLRFGLSPTKRYTLLGSLDFRPSNLLV